MNPDNPKYKQLNSQKVLFALIDGQWHRNKELKERTKLTARTLSKHLGELEKNLHWVERKEDTESGEYPHPVLYKATNAAIPFIKYMDIVFQNADTIEKEIDEVTDPLKVLRKIHKGEEYYLYLTILEIATFKYMTKEQLDGFLDFTFYRPHQIYIEALIGAITKAAQFGATFEITHVTKPPDLIQPKEKD